MVIEGSPLWVAFPPGEEDRGDSSPSVLFLINFDWAQTVSKLSGLSKGQKSLTAPPPRSGTYPPPHPGAGRGARH